MDGQRKHLPAGERRAATVEAVVDLAAEQNPSDITTAAIAQRMGLTQGALFRHFPTKEAILQAVMSWVSERLLARVDEATRGAASPAAALEAIFMTHIDFVVRHPGVPRMLFGELQRAGDSLPKKKPDPLPLLHACKHFDILPKAALLIGDSSNDAIAARAAGCHIFCVPYGYNEGHDVRELDCDAVVDTIMDATRLITYRHNT